MRKPKRFDTSIRTPCRHMTDRDKGLCCAIKGLKLADPGKVRHRTRIVMPEAAGSLLSLKSFMDAIAFRLHSRKFFMHEFHYAKEHVTARTFHKAFRLIKKYLLLGLLVAIALKAQQSSPSAQTWLASYARLPANLWPERR